jgi:hypothetical protein
MFDFQKEVIINSAEVDGLARVAAISSDAPKVRTSGTPAKPLTTGDVLSVLRCAEYKIDNIVEVVKTVGQAGTPEVITLAVPAVAENDTLVGKTIHAEIVIGLEGKYTADYANVWSNFGKDIVVEYVAETGTPAELAKHIKDALPLDNEFVKVSDSAVTMVNSNQIVKKAFVCLVNNDVEGAHTDLTHTGRTREFATGAWLKENLRFPTHLNLRYDNVAGDDAPIDGATYIQYSFQYESERKGLHGQGTVGQKLTSVTTHTFYVNKTLTDIIAVFDAVMNKAKDGKATYPVLESDDNGKPDEPKLPEVE